MARPTDNESSARRPVRRPPNYFSRRVQLRLLVLVAMFMLVIVLMDEARKPKYYRWMWGEQNPPAEAAPAAEDAPNVDTRLPPQGNRASRPADAMNTSSGQLDPESIQFAASRQKDAVGRAAIDAWADVLAGLTGEQRQALDQLLLTSRLDERLSPAQQKAWAAAFRVLQMRWSEYLERARKTLASSDMPADEQAAWSAVLKELSQRWSGRWAVAGDAAFEERLLTAKERVALAEVQHLLDELALASIEDHAVLRTAERSAWFRLMEDLRGSGPQSLHQRSRGDVTYLQLYEQPREYRGQLVTIRGTARMGYRVKAPRNIYGFKEYSILWVRPFGGPNRPLVVYCLNTPGLPPLADRRATGEMTELEQEVKFDAYFFKNWAYRAKDGINTAPLLLAKAPQIGSAAADAGGGGPSFQLLGLAVGGAAALGVLVALVMFSLNQWPSRSSSAVREPEPDHIRELGEHDQGDPIVHTLRVLEQSDLDSKAEEDP